MNDEWIGWHFLGSDRRLGYGDGRLVVVGETLKLPDGGRPILRERGFHASRKATDALSYAPGDVVCKVRLSGVVIEGDDKAVASERTALAMADAKSTLHEYACWCAEQVVHLTGKDEAVCRKAIDTKRKWLRGQATDDELAAARDAAARSAAWSSDRSAARAAAVYAAWDTARNVAWSAAVYAAWDTARNVAWSAGKAAQESKLVGMFEDLLRNAA